MSVHELNRAQIRELKERYMMTLADEGVFNDVIYGRPELDEEDGEDPSLGELAEADRLVPDDVIFRQYDGIDFTDGDFFSACGEDAE